MACECCCPKDIQRTFNFVIGDIKFKLVMNLSSDNRNLDIGLGYINRADELKDVTNTKILADISDIITTNFIGKPMDNDHIVGAYHAIRSYLDTEYKWRRFSIFTLKESETDAPI